MKNKILCAGFAAVFLSFGAAAMDANAQNPTRRKKKTATKPAAAVQPSRDENRGVYLDGNQIVLNEIPQPMDTTASEPVSQTVDEQAAESGDNARFRELNDRIKSLEAGRKNEYDEKQKRLLLNLDILTRAETRAESLRKQLFEMVEKQTSVQTRLTQIEYDARPEVIERSTAFVGSLRPEEIRDQRRKSLEAERKNLESLLAQIQTNRASLEENVQKADFLVEKIRVKLDKDIDDALVEKEENQ